MCNIASLHMIHDISKILCNAIDSEGLWRLSGWPAIEVFSRFLARTMMPRMFKYSADVIPSGRLAVFRALFPRLPLLTVDITITVLPFLMVSLGFDPERVWISCSHRRLELGLGLM